MKDKVTSFYKDAAGAVDAGLRKYMLNVFSYMSAGLALTAVVAYCASCSPTLMGFLYGAPLVSILMAFAPLAIAIYLTAKLGSISAERAKTLFLVYAASLGLSMSWIFAVYSGSSIVGTFFITSSMFLSMVVYGYVTDKDLTNWGAYLTMALIGLIIASVVNMFTRSSGFELLISAIGVVVFTGLTAYDAQVIKSYYFDSDSVEISEKKAIFGALRLYLDFVNLFFYILRFMGSRRD
ncbi:MAG: Bax inhibitor-1/YccA family protein [Holosporaceae bacterium]|jgi:FtsH-binding integral membrane protein|nr:Bax inhibitor-1/YccA family protein [Holosporaceae bacterium]